MKPASTLLAIDDRSHLGQELQRLVASGIVEFEGPLEPGGDLLVHALLIVDGRQLQPLAKRRRNANMDDGAVFGGHDRDLWLKGVQPEIGAPCAIYVSPSDISYPQPNKAIVTDGDIPLSKVKSGWTHE